MIKGFSAGMVAACLFTFTACGGNFTEDSGASTPSETQEITEFDNTFSPLAERIGVANWGAMYMPGLAENEHSIHKGAEYIRAMGSKVIKIACGNPAVQYPLDDWSALDMKQCVDALKFPVYKRLFEMDFSTYFISITEVARVKYADGLSESERNTVEEEFYQATKYLLETYRGSGKTFILQNWETDNYVGYSVNGGNAEYVFRNYAKYFNARQDGINRARDEFVMSEENNVFVFGALEVNRLSSDYTGIRAVDYTVPYTYADLYAYSSYEFKDKGVVSSAEEVCGKLTAALEYYRSKLPSAETYPQKAYFCDKRLAITEFGYPDKADGYTGEQQKTVAEGHVLAVQKLGLQYGIYWQLCCNELTCDNASSIKALSPNELRKYVFEDGDLNGFYLLRPNGETTYTYKYLSDICNGAVINK